MRIKTFACIFLCMFILVAPASAATVSVGDVTLHPGQQKNVSIMITDSGQNVGGADINLAFDPDVVHVVGVGNSDFTDNFIPNIDNAAGLVRMSGSQWTALTTPITFAEVRLQGIGNPGDSTHLNLTIDSLRDGMGSPIYPRELDNGAASIIVMLSPTVPAFSPSGLLSLIGLLALIAVLTIRNREQ